MPELPLLDTENYTGKKRGRAQKVAGHHRNTLSAVRRGAIPIWRIFSYRKLLSRIEDLCPG